MLSNIVKFNKFKIFFGKLWSYNIILIIGIVQNGSYIVFVGKNSWKC